MIREYELYHGSVLRRIIGDSETVKFSRFATKYSNGAAYVINERVGLYIKHSTSRLSPWSFTFTHEHQTDIEKLNNIFGEVFTCLVCNDDGIVCLNYSELKNALDEEFKSTEWIRISRRKREKYTVSGSDGKLRTKIGENEFPAKIFTGI